MKLGLALAFLVTAALYASAGFGGGSTYTALLAVSGAPFYTIPVVSLLCNICVVAGNCLRYFNKRIIAFKDIWPFLILSIPAAFLGGRLNVPEVIFIGLLCLALGAAGIRMLFAQQHSYSAAGAFRGHALRSSLIGGAIGFYSGIVGIGGGIFLAPILYKFRWGRAHEIAALCSVFILMNSLAGLSGQIIKINQLDLVSEVMPYAPLILAVFIGGTVGNVLSLKFLNANTLRRITGLLILIVAARLLLKWIGLMEA